MQGNQPDTRRVRNVPIRIEGEMNGSSRYNTEPQRRHQGQNFESRGRGYQSGDREHWNNQPSHNQHRPDLPDQLNQSGSPHTSSIDINYKPQPGPHHGQQQRHHQQQQQQHKCNDQQDNRHASSEEPSRRAEKSSRLDAQQSDKHEFNKENSESNGYRSPEDFAMQETDGKKSEELRPSPIPPVIPLPPPPSQAKPADEKTNERGQQQQPHHEEEEEQDGRKTTKETGPLAVINATKAEVNRLLQEVARCEETSTKSKVFLRLEELLTLCILKLDNIDASELRQQRKEVINMINKCTDILERKINLNNDIQQLAASCQ